MPTPTIDGRQINVLQRGEGEPLLLIQGMSGTHLSWGEPFLSELARHFALTVFDNRGVGGSSRIDDDVTIADMAEDAAGVLDAVGLERAHVLGISMGGMIAQELALRHPERVSTLTLGCTYAGGEGSRLTSAAVLQRLGEAWRSGDREHSLRTGWAINVSERFAGDEEAYRAFRRAALELPVPVKVIMKQIQAIGGHDVLDRLGEITAPTLVIHGDEDQMLVVENGRLIASRIPGARLEELEGVGHLFWIEEPRRTAELVREHAAERAATG